MSATNDPTYVVEVDEHKFTSFVHSVEPRLRRALIARCGHERGRDATCEALAWAYENWEHACSLESPTAYLYRVGVSRTRGRRSGFLPARADTIPDVEPALAAALASLTRRQRVAVVLVRGFQWELHEVAELLGVSVPTVNTHVRRGVLKLRKKIGDGDG